MGQIVLWIVFAIVAIAAIGYAAKHNTRSFLDNAVGNLLATMIGLILGVTIALQINGYQQREQTRQERAARDEESSQQKKRVLELTRQELAFDLEQIKSRWNGPKRQVTLPPLKTDLWRALAASGDIKWINSPPLLDAVSTAYFWINITAQLETKAFDVGYYPGLTVRPSVTPEGWKPVGE